MVAPAYSSLTNQDAAFVVSETYGEVIKTRVFEDFCTEQGLKLWVCNKADPESKGPILCTAFCYAHLLGREPLKINSSITQS